MGLAVAFFACQPEENKPVENKPEEKKEGAYGNITVKVLGGDLTVNYTPERVTLTGSAVLVFEGTFAY